MAVKSGAAVVHFYRVDALRADAEAPVERAVVAAEGA
jgi:hypothetical protein